MKSIASSAAGDLARGRAIVVSSCFSSSVIVVVVVKDASEV